MKAMRTLVLPVLVASCWGTSFAQQQLVSGDHLQGTQLMSETEIERFHPDMLEGIFQHFKRVLESSPNSRESRWHRDYSSSEAYLESIAPNRARFREIICLRDERKSFEGLTLVETTSTKALVAETETYKIYSVRWPVFHGVSGAGLWIEPRSQVRAQIVVVPDADQSPEQLIGLSPGVPAGAQFARSLAEAGCRIIIPVIINRDDTWSGNPEIQMTNQSHREFIYRRAYVMGRHIIGYEVQKIMAAIDWFSKQSTKAPIGVAGHGEGGLLALYSAAADTRIDGALVSGYFQEREKLWEEPIYRNVWGLLEEFGDAEIASLIAPRPLVVEAAKGPEVEGPSAATDEENDAAAPGRLITSPLESVQRETSRAMEIYKELGTPGKLQLVVSGKGTGLPGSAEAIEAFLAGLGINHKKVRPKIGHLVDMRNGFDPETRLHDQFIELSEHLDVVVNQSAKVRQQFWEKADYSSIEKWTETTKPYRDYYWEEVIGKMPSPSQPFNPRSKLTYDTPNWRGYWVKLDVWPGIVTGGILLIPKDIRPGERRPVVVVQHGNNGDPVPLVDPKVESAYHSFGARLADQGYIVYAPNNPYGRYSKIPSNEKSFRVIQRMANPLKQSMFTVIIGQHDQTLDWLKQLPFVDGQRMGFYGLSYGGTTAMWVPPVVEDYAVVICSANFNEWIRKLTSIDDGTSFMFYNEYEFYEFNLGNTVSFAEAAGLIAPRPFMVERGHGDGVGRDEWVAYEFAKVRKLYNRLGIPDRTTIEFFNGKHEINGVGTFEFLDKHLKHAKQ